MIGEDQIVEVVLPQALTPVKVTLKYDLPKVDANAIRRVEFFRFGAWLYSAESGKDYGYGHHESHALNPQAIEGIENYYAIPGQIQIFSLYKN